MGDVVVNEAGVGTDFELSIDKNAIVNGDAKANRIELSRNSSVTGNVHYNELESGKATIGGAELAPLNLPVFDFLPTFETSNPRPDAENVSVGPNETINLETGDYGDIWIGGGGLLVLNGGIYQVRSVNMNTNSA